jgi:hypothetical protein
MIDISYYTINYTLYIHIVVSLEATAVTEASYNLDHGTIGSIH